MSKSIVMLPELNKIIAQYKENAPVQGALLVLKGQAKPRLKEGIPKQVAVAIISAASSAEAHLVKVFESEDDLEMFAYHDDRLKALGNVIEIVYADDKD